MGRNRSVTQLLHSMHEFGVVAGLTQAVRVNRLELRLAPLVPFPHKHAFFHIVAITKGGGWHEIDFARHPARPGSIFFMRPSQVHSWSFKKGTRGYVLEFPSPAVLPAEMRAALAPALRAIPAADHATPSALPFTLLEAMAAAYEAEWADFELFLRASLPPLLLALAADADRPAEDRASSLAERFQALLETNFPREHRVEFYARQLGLTPKALTMRLARAGLSAPRELVQERCLLEAKRLLAYSDLTIGQVGEAAGFTDPNYFARLFKKRARLSPGRFRQRARNLC